MDINKIIYDIETHPFVVAIVLFVVVFLGFNMFRKNNSLPVSSDTSTTPKTTETYYQQFNSFPIATPTPVPPEKPKPVVLPPVSNKPPIPPKPSAIYVTVTKWPNPGSSLWSIAQLHGISLDKIKQLNPQYSKNWDLIYPGNQVRVQ